MEQKSGLRTPLVSCMAPDFEPGEGLDTSEDCCIHRDEQTRDRSDQDRTNSPRAALSASLSSIVYVSRDVQPGLDDDGDDDDNNGDGVAENLNPSSSTIGKHSFLEREASNPSFDRLKSSRSFSADILFSTRGNGDGEFTTTQYILNGMSPSEYQKIVIAAVYVEDAKYSRSADHLVSEDAIKVYRLYHRSSVHWLFRLNLIALLLSGVFEEPAAVYLPPSAVCVVQTLCLIILMAKKYLEYRFLGKEKFFLNGWSWVMTILLPIDLLLLFVAWGLQGHSYLWTRLCRAAYLVEASSISRTVFSNVLKTIPGIIDAVACVFCVHLLYVVLCMVLFEQSPQGCRYFDGFFNSWYNMLVLLTTANFPDIMLPAYSESWWYSLIFISFLVIDLYLLMSLVLASVYNKYRNELKNDIRHAIQNKSLAISRAFHLLKSRETDGISLNRWRKLFAVMRPWYPLEKVDILFDILDMEGQGFLSSKEFPEILDVLNLRVISVRESRNIWENCFPSFYNSTTNQIFCRFIDSWVFDMIVDLILVAYTIFLIVITNRRTSIVEHQCSGQDFIPSSATLAVEYLFTGLYVVEMFLRVYAKGFQACWQSAWFKSDFVVLLLVIFGTTFSVVTEDRTVKKTFQVIRAVRLMRLLLHIKRFYRILHTLFSLLEALAVYGILLIGLYYFYGVLGIGLFGGLISPSNSDPSFRESVFFRENYFPNNFNTLPEAFVTLFELTVVNNWQVIVSGYEALRGAGVRFFFISFWLIAVVVVMNIVIAFIIEAFVSQYDKLSDMYKNNLLDGGSSSTVLRQGISGEEANLRLRLSKASSKDSIDDEPAHEQSRRHSNNARKSRASSQFAHLRNSFRKRFSFRNRKQRAFDLLISTVADDQDGKVECIPLSDDMELKVSP